MQWLRTMSCLHPSYTLRSMRMSTYIRVKALHKYVHIRIHNASALVHVGLHVINTTFTCITRGNLTVYVNLCADLYCTLQFPHLYAYLCVHTYHVRNNYVTCIVVARWPFVDFGNLDGCFQQLCVATMSSLPQLWFRDGYREAEAT